jgi:CRISPR-associated protein Csb2
MFSIAVRYLNGWAMATHPADRGRAEWPPHPDRVFMALVAAAGEETRFDDALRWLEAQPPPALFASAHEQRAVVTSYVPVNDPQIARPRGGRNEQIIQKAASLVSIEDARSAGLALMPESRPRQARAFPVAVPHDPIVHFIYRDDAPAGVLEQLAALCTRVSRVGHSASLVQCWLHPAPPQANLEPSEAVAGVRLRIPSKGRLQYLRELYALSVMQGSDLRPTAGAWAAYGPACRPTPSDVSRSVYDPAFLVLCPAETEARRPPLVATLQLTEALRGTLLGGLKNDIPEAFAGHFHDGRPLDRPHLAIAPLPFIGGPHADGRIMGMALVLPRTETDASEISRAAARVLYDDHGLAPRQLKLVMGSAGAWSLEACDNPTRESLRPEAWTADPRGATCWATVTPIVFDRHPKGGEAARAADEAKQIIAQACTYIGLPEPSQIEIGPVSAHAGVPHARSFPPFRRKNGSVPNHKHAVLVFDTPVVGPVIIGAGRYRGYGLCKPLCGGAQ